MTRSVVVNQLHFLPRLFHVKRVVDVDVFVMMDDHQFGPQWQKRTIIKTSTGSRLLTLPMKGGQRQHIRDVVLDLDQDWHRQVMKTLAHAYGRAPYWREISPEIETLLAQTDRLYELNRLVWMWLLVGLGAEVEIVEQSRLGRFEERKTDLMIAIAKAVHAEVYVCGQIGIEQFYEMERFMQAGIAVQGQDWRCPPYPQLWGPFDDQVSIVDALFNVGFEGTRRILGLGA